MEAPHNKKPFVIENDLTEFLNANADTSGYSTWSLKFAFEDCLVAGQMRQEQAATNFSVLINHKSRLYQPISKVNPIHFYHV